MRLPAVFLSHGAPPLVDDELLLIVGQHHRLAKKRSVAVKEIERERLVLFERGSSIRRATDQFFDQVGIRPALALESNLSARKLLLRSVELESTLGRRFLAARAAWQLGDLPVVRDEMTVLVAEAAAEGDRAIQSRALTALSEVAASLDGELVRAAELADEALAVVEADDHDGRFRALDRRARVARWAGREAEAEEYLQQALEAARAAARKDHEARAALQLAGIYVGRMEEDKAAPLIDRALALAEESGSIVARASAAQSKGGLHRVRRQYEEAEGWLTKALDLYRETASVPEIAWTSRQLAQVAVFSTKARELGRLGTDRQLFDPVFARVAQRQARV